MLTGISSPQDWLKKLVILLAFVTIALICGLIILWQGLQQPQTSVQSTPVFVQASAEVLSSKSTRMLITIPDVSLSIPAEAVGENGKMFLIYRDPSLARGLPWGETSDTPNTILYSSTLYMPLVFKSGPKVVELKIIDLYGNEMQAAFDTQSAVICFNLSDHQRTAKPGSAGQFKLYFKPDLNSAWIGLETQVLDGGTSACANAVGHGIYALALGNE